MKISEQNFADDPVAKTLHSNEGNLSLIPGQGTRSHMPQLSPSGAKQINTLKRKTMGIFDHIFLLWKTAV